MKVEEGEMKMEMEIKKAEEETKGPVASTSSTSKIEGPENIIFNLDLWKRKLTAGEDPPKRSVTCLTVPIRSINFKRVSSKYIIY